MTSRDGASAAISGFKVFGSARSDSTSRPPERPTSPGRDKSSSAGFACCALLDLGETKKSAQTSKGRSVVHRRGEIARQHFMMGFLHATHLSSPSPHPRA